MILFAFSVPHRPATSTRVTHRARFGKHEVLEGAPTEGIAILEFPTSEKARAWYTSPAYQEASKHRFQGGDYRFILVEGV